MSTGATPDSFDDIPFDVIGALAESTDARIRGNAVQALAILASDKGSSLAGRAQELLIRALAAGPASLEPEWHRRFRTRALDALRELGQEQREDVLKKVMIANMRSTDKNQRTAVSALLWEARSADLFLSPNWLQLRRLAGRAGQTKFWIVLWAAAWRYGWLLFVSWSLLLLLNWLRPEFAPDQESSIWDLTFLYILLVLPTFVLTQVAFVGRPRLPLVYAAGDILVSGLVFGAICIIGISWLMGDTAPGILQYSTGKLLSLGILGFIVGAGIRSIKWFPEANVLVGYQLRPVWAFLIATIACMAAAWLGLNPRLSGAAWITIASAAVVIAALDDWLEKRGPDLNTTSKTAGWRLTALLAATIFLFVVGTVYNYLNAKPTKMPEARKVILPDDLQTDFPKIVEEKSFPALNLIVKQEGRYTIQASASPSADIALTVQSDDANYNKRAGKQESLTLTDRLTEGSYKGCVDFAHLKDCQSRNYVVGRPSILDLATVFIAGKPISEPGNLFRITISHANDESKDTAPK